jgi:NAD dependent epimerase/dehydratase family enzyme
MPWEPVHWDSESLGHWTSSLESADAVINVSAAANISARLRTTALIAEAISQCQNPPQVWLNLSSAVPDPEWEAAVFAVATPTTRKVLLRLSQVMHPAFGVFPSLLRLVRLGFGGEMGSGEQSISWIHDLDLIRAVEFLVDNDVMEGPVNVSSPGPLANHEFMAELREAWSSNYFGASMPAWLIRDRRLLDSVRVFPEVLLDAGFQFEFPELTEAARDLVLRWRQT